MPVVPSDYDDDPDRWASRDAAVQVFGDVHEPVAAQIRDARLQPVLDVGGGQGALDDWLPPGWPTILLDRSAAQLRAASGVKLRADASHLPVRDDSVGAVTMLWMLYHVDEPRVAIAEARRVLRPGGLFVASTTSRRNDPELTDAYPPTPFDAEDASDLVGSVFATTWVERWDAPMTYLADRAAVLRYCRSHCLGPEAAERVEPPVWLTKRGCLVYARKP